MSLTPLVESTSRQGGHTEATGAWPREGGIAAVASPLCQHRGVLFVLGAPFFLFCLFVWVIVIVVVVACLFVLLFCSVFETGSDCVALAYLELTT